MSTSIVNESNLRHLAATVVALTKAPEDSQLGIAARQFIQEVIGDNTPASPTHLAAQIYNKMVELNNDGLAANYPDITYMRNPLPIISSLSVKDNKLPLLTPNGMLHFKESMKIFMHGLHDNSPESITNLYDAISDTKTKVSLSFAQNNGITSVTPDISELAESSTRLRNHGDILLDMQNGFMSSLDRITMIPGHDPTFSTAQEILNNFYLQAQKAAQLPASEKVKVKVDERGFETPRYLKSTYRIQSDIPHPNERDVFNVIAALQVISDNLHKMEVIFDDMPDKLSPQQYARIANHFKEVANGLHDQYTSGLHGKISQAYYLPHEEMCKKLANYHTPNIAALIVFPAGKDPLDDEYQPRKILPPRVAAADEMLSRHARSRLIVPNNTWSADDISTQIPGAEVFHVTLSGKDIEKLGFMHKTPYRSAVPLLAEQAVYQVFDDMKVPYDLKNFEFNYDEFANRLSSRNPFISTEDIMECCEFTQKYPLYTQDSMASNFARRVEQLVSQNPEMDRPAKELKQIHVQAPTPKDESLAPGLTPSSSPKM